MNIIGNMVSAIVGGIVVAAVSYWLFTDRPQLPRIEVEETYISMPTAVGSALYQSSLQELEAMGWKRPSPSASDLMELQLRFFSGYLLKKYTVTNLDTKIYKDVMVKSSGLIVSVVSEGGKAQLFAGDRVHKFQINPNDSISIYGLSDGVEYPVGIESSPQLFVAVGDYPVPVINSRIIDYGILSDVVGYIGENPFFSFMILVVMISLSAASLLIILLTATVMIYPRASFKVINDSEWGKNLAMLHLMSIEDKRRFARVEAVSAFWSSRLNVQDVPKNEGI